MSTYPPIPGKTIVALLLATCISAHSAVLYSANFEGETAGSSPGSNWTLNTVAGVSYTVRNTSEFGASNQFVEFNDTSSTSGGFGAMLHNTAITGGQLTTFSLDFIATNNQGILFGYSPSTTAFTALGSSYTFRVQLTNGQVSGWDSGINNWVDFGTGLFNLNTAYQLTMVMNDSGVAVNYAGRSVADNSYDLWIRALSDGGSTYLGSGAFVSSANYYSAARSLNAPTPKTLIDNWTVQTGAVVTPVPEPSAMWLTLFGGLMCLRRKR